MSYLCQKQPYLKDLTTKVISCQIDDLKKCFKIELEKSLFFPEGGGQPSDGGMIGEENLIWVSRAPGKIYHYIEKSIDVGTIVNCKLDWERRFDHMQHHSGQHLLSAILDKYDIPTVSWELGSQYCNVEIKVDIKKMTFVLMEKIENQVNEKIRQALPVITHEYSIDQVNQLIEQGKLKNILLNVLNISNDSDKLLTFIEIKDTDLNMCCGTHVKCLSDIQIVKLLYTEQMRGNTRLFFICGDRVLKKFSKSFLIERQFNKLLACQPENHVERVEAIKKNEKYLEKFKGNLLKQLAIYDSDKYLANLKLDEKFLFIHKEDYDNTYLQTLTKLLNEKTIDKKDLVIFLVCGSLKSSGMFSIKASNDFFEKNEAMILELLLAKGKARNGILQGKAESLKNLKKLTTELEKLLI